MIFEREIFILEKLTGRRSFFTPRVLLKEKLDLMIGILIILTKVTLFKCLDFGTKIVGFRETTIR